MPLDDFNRANGNLTTNWSALFGKNIPRIVSNQATNQTAADSGARWTGAGTPFSNDQYARFAYESGTDLSPIVRAASGAEQWYEGNQDAGTYGIYKDSGGTYTQIGSTSAGTPSAGDVMELQASGTTLKFYVNPGTQPGSGTPLISGTDASFSSGSIGFICYGDSTGTIDNFDGGNLSASFAGDDDYDWSPPPVQPFLPPAFELPFEDTDFFPTAPFYRWDNEWQPWQSVQRASPPPPPVQPFELEEDRIKPFPLEEHEWAPWRSQWSTTLAPPPVLPKVADEEYGYVTMRMDDEPWLQGTVPVQPAAEWFSVAHQDELPANFVPNDDVWTFSPPPPVVLPRVFPRVDPDLWPSTIITDDRKTTWANAGLLVPGWAATTTRSTTFTTLSPSGGDDTATIQAALNACPSGQVVQLDYGKFLINSGNILFVPSGVTLRGRGLQQTIIAKTNGATLGSGSPGASPSPVIIVGSSRYTPAGPYTTSNLANDGAKGSYSVDLASAAGFSVGDLVLVDELSGASWQPDPLGIGVSVLASADGRVIWQCHKVITTDTLGTGNGSTATFSGTLSVTPVWNTTIVVTAGGVTGTDDGLGNISGTGIASGTINYSTGAVSVTFSSAPGVGVSVTCQFGHPAQFIDDPVAYDALTGTIGNGSDAPSWFCRQDRPQCEVKKVTGISGNTLTFSSPLHISYRTSHTAQVLKFEATPVVRAGLEDFSCYGGDDGGIRFNWTEECWIRNVESYAWLGEGIAIYRSFRFEARQLYSRDAAWPSPGGGGYAIALMGGSSDCLVWDTISLRTNKVIVSRCSGAGSVVAYSYMDDGFINFNGGWQEIGLNASHMVGPHHVLFDGCLCFNADSDNTHGNSTFITWFRNYLRGVREPYVNRALYGGDEVRYDDTLAGTTDGPLRSAGSMGYTRWSSFVGNVLGRPGRMGGYTYDGNFTGGPSMYKLGWSGTPPYSSDPTTLATTVRHANYDFLNNAQVFDPGISNQSIPNSLFLSAAPDWWPAGYAWPPYDPTTGADPWQEGVLPAFDRVVNIMQAFGESTDEAIPPSAPPPRVPEAVVAKLAADDATFQGSLPSPMVDENAWPLRPFPAQPPAPWIPAAAVNDEQQPVIASPVASEDHAPTPVPPSPAPPPLQEPWEEVDLYPTAPVVHAVEEEVGPAPPRPAATGRPPAAFADNSGDKFVLVAPMVDEDLDFPAQVRRASRAAASAALAAAGREDFLPVPVYVVGTQSVAPAVQRISVVPAEDLDSVVGTPQRESDV